MTSSVENRSRVLPPADGRPLEGAVVFLTGAAGGLGTATTRELLDRGATVLMADNDEARLDGVVESLGAGASVVPFVLDITSPEAITDAFARIAESQPRLDVVINNAGLIHADNLMDVSLETWRRVFSINVEGPLLVSQQAGRLMRGQEVSRLLDRRGLILNVSSRSARVGRPFSSAYGASKAAIEHLTLSLSSVLAEDAIASAAIQPGDVKEGMLSYLMPQIAAVQHRDLAEVEQERTYQAPSEHAAILCDFISLPGLGIDATFVGQDRVIHPISA